MPGLYEYHRETGIGSDDTFKGFTCCLSHNIPASTTSHAPVLCALWAEAVFSPEVAAFSRRKKALEM